ncbi:predicted protein [Plenodomus lingam JN3]|uniref:Uncharacterized protein n=1 Tax=Leptosphaeria maculans (strain JN3 / isolate v23.1.3 / race Av1-4-5-6-7-8) TaxID=985895 RepID=E4ZGH9_LEPMJ|nr:predicted protein [Plenodomus lingam JN3]CBX90399.1 predicted protein [Plenodomus lingam JN3]
MDHLKLTASVQLTNWDATTSPTVYEMYDGQKTKRKISFQS